MEEVESEVQTAENEEVVDTYSPVEGRGSALGSTTEEDSVGT